MSDIVSHSTLINGDLAQVIVTKEAMKQGYSVALPISGSSHYDLVIRNSRGKFFAIQVKKAYRDSLRGTLNVEVCRNSFQRRTRTQRIKYTEEQVDYFIVCDANTEDCWIFPLTYVNRFNSRFSLETGSSLQFKNNWEILI